MDPQFFQTVSLVAIFAGFLLNEWRRGELRPPTAGREDDRLDIAILLMFPVVFSGVLAASTALCAWLIPEQQGAFAHWSWWAMLGTLLIADDLTQYWWHRLSHTSLMWPLHRVHHSVEDDETNSNFGFNLPWWDRLFGTYRAQPRAGHDRMTIGIHGHSDPREVARLPGMLLMPFRGTVDGYAINLRRWSGKDGER